MQTTPEQSAYTTFEIIKKRHPLFANALANKKRLVIIPGAGAETFYTSDHPVVLRNLHCDVVGLHGRGIEIFLPLSPNLVLCFLCPQHVAFRSDSKFTEAVAKGDQVSISAKDVGLLNELQVRRCSRFVFSCSDSFDIARHLLDAEPSASDPPRIEILEHQIRVR